MPWGDPGVTEFQSTPPKREATGLLLFFPKCAKSFNPRLPNGRRPFFLVRLSFLYWFQSTPPKREATPSLYDPIMVFEVSIHASQTGGDQQSKMIGATNRVSIHASQTGGDHQLRTWVSA